MKPRTSLATLALGAVLAYAGLRLDEAPGPLATPRDVLVPHGDSATVAHALRDTGVIANARSFRLIAALTSWQGGLRAAEFAFPAHASLGEVLRILREGRPVQHLLTIPEGLSSAQITAVLARARGVSGPIAVPAEAEVLPESYAYVLGTDATAMLARAERDMAALTGRIWRDRAPDLPLATSRDMVILASLVERETHLPAERALVARVFLNRLRLGMRLQSDAAVAYAESGGQGELAQGLTKDALARATPYNTYVVAGLPAGPICAPGRAALEAVAHPARSDALYFVADGTGGHAFADTLAEHERNVARYRLLGR